MRPPKYHPHGSVLFLTMSIEEGLLLLSNPLCEAILKSCLARAQHLHPVQISHFLVEATHLHMVCVVVDPSDIAQFVRYFKTESAHMLNRLLGRRKRTIWCEGYDSPVVLTPIRALIAIAYLYANPAKDNLVETLDDYPGLSSWRLFRDNSLTRMWKRIVRPQLATLSPDQHNNRGYTAEARRILSESRSTHLFQLMPNAWMAAFGIKLPEDQERLNRSLVGHIDRLERRARELRTRNGKRIMGRDRLLHQPLDTHYRPSRAGKRMCCLSENRKIRIHFLRFLKELRMVARTVWERWKQGDFSVAYPLGLYPPSMPKLAEPIPAW